MNKIKIGVMGCANIAWRLMIPNIVDNNKFKLVAVASRSKEKADKFAERFKCKSIVGYEQLLKEDINCVYIPLPTGMQFDWIIKSLNAGKHILSEKSIATSLSKVKKIIQKAEEKKLCVFENFMFVYHSQLGFVKQKIKDGEIGNIKLLRSSFGFPMFDSENNIRYNKKLGGGALLDAGAYTLMASQFLLGLNQKLIAAYLNKAGREVEFHGSIMLLNEKNIISQLSFGFDNFYQNNIELWGDKGKMIITRAFTAGPEFMPKIIIEKQNEHCEYSLPADNHFKKILDAFGDAVHNKNFDIKYKQILNQSILLEKARKYE